MPVLERHPQSQGGEGFRVEAAAARLSPGLLALRYRVEGLLSALRLAPPASPERTDGLWRSTCFEAFVRLPEGDAYHELNFAPSSQWAAYGFSGYRDGMTPADVPAPRIAAAAAADACEISVGVDLDALPGLAAAPWRLALSAVLEDAEGRISYWAIRHPAGKADFHHPDSFALTLDPR